MATMAAPISVNIGNGLGPGAQRENSFENGGYSDRRSKNQSGYLSYMRGTLSPAGVTAKRLLYLT